MDIEDQHGKPVDIHKLETDEQELARKYIEENDVVFELGARYGSVSCIINSKLKCKTNQVVVEPDERVWGALERNKTVNNCQFHIVKGFVSRKKLGLTNLNEYYGGYASTAIEQNNSKIPSFSMEELHQQTNLKFNVLVADCEGFLEEFFDENPTFVDSLRLVIFEADYREKCNYEKIRSMLKGKGFKEVLHGHQNVWSRQVLTIITPSCRPTNLQTIAKSIRFDLIDMWYIIYDTSKDRTYEKQFIGHPKIRELEWNKEGVAGHPQRNYGMTQVKNGFIYFLDDDNIIHPTFWELSPTFLPNHFYTFDQLRTKQGQVLRGNHVEVNHIDTAMFVVPISMVGSLLWNESQYNADGIFINAIYKKNIEYHIYYPKIACHYNYLV